MWYWNLFAVRRYVVIFVLLFEYYLFLLVYWKRNVILHNSMQLTSSYPQEMFSYIFIITSIVLSLAFICGEKTRLGKVNEDVTPRPYIILVRFTSTEKRNGKHIHGERNNDHNVKATTAEYSAINLRRYSLRTYKKRISASVSGICQCNFVFIRFEDEKKYWK